MGFQDYFRMKNVFSGDEGGDESPFRTVSFNGNDSPDEPSPDEEEQVSVDAQGPDEVSALDQFRESVLNPPNMGMGGRRNMLQMIGTGLYSGLRGTEDDRMKTIYNEQGKAIGKKPMGFWDKFGSKPLGIEEAGNVMNIPNNAKMADWKVRTGGLKDAATIESQNVRAKGLAEQRLANAKVIPERETRLGRQGDTRNDQGQQRINILKDKEAKNTLTDREKIELTGLMRSNQIGQQGMIRSGQIQQQGGIRSGQIAQQGAIRSGQIDQQGKIRSGQIAQSGDEARETKQVVPGKSSVAVGGDKPESATQTKTRLQLRANEYIQAHPEHADFVQINPNTGMIDVTPPATANWYGGMGSGPDDKTYKEIVAYMKSGTSDKAATPAEKKAEAKGGEPKPPVPGKKPVGSVVEPTNSGKDAVAPGQKKITQRSPSTGKTRTSTDGGKTWTYN